MNKLKTKGIIKQMTKIDEKQNNYLALLNSNIRLYIHLIFQFNQTTQREYTSTDQTKRHIHWKQTKVTIKRSDQTF